MKGRYSKAWWNTLDPRERSELVSLMTAHGGSGYGAGGYLPDDCSECSNCSNPMLGGGGLCHHCYTRYETLHTAADEAFAAGKGVRS